MWINLLLQKFWPVFTEYVLKYFLILLTFGVKYGYKVVRNDNKRFILFITMIHQYYSNNSNFFLEIVGYFFNQLKLCNNFS